MSERDTFDLLGTENNINDETRKIKRRLGRLARRNVETNSLEEMSAELGDMISGRFIAPADSATSGEPTDAGFTGAFMSGNGEEFPDGNVKVGGVAAGQLQAGITDAGKLIAGEGAVSVDVDGVNVRVDNGGAELDKSSIKWRNLSDEIIGKVSGYTDGSLNNLAVGIPVTSAESRVSVYSSSEHTSGASVKMRAQRTTKSAVVEAQADASQSSVNITAQNINVSGNVTGITASQVGAVPGSSFASGTIADDGFASFDLPSTQGIIIITQTLGGAVAEHLIAYFNTSTPRLNAWDTGASTAVTTGALTGTTGTDGNFTASVHTNGKLYLENRRGGNRAYRVVVLS